MLSVIWRSAGLLIISLVILFLRTSCDTTPPPNDIPSSTLKPQPGSLSTPYLTRTPTSTPDPSSTPSSTPTYTPAPVTNTPASSILQVGGPGQYRSIQEAIDSAQPGTTIQVAQGIYQENVTINNPKIIKLEGGWKPDFSSRSSNNTLTIIDGGGHGSVFKMEVCSGANVTMSIEGFTIRKGIARDGAGMHIAASGVETKIEITLSNDTIMENTSSFYGGGISIGAMGGSSINVNLTDYAILNNTAENIGGSVHFNSTGGGIVEAKLLKNTIKGNLSKNIDAGGIGVYASGIGNTTVSLTNNLIMDNQAEFGGGILGYAWGEQGTATITMTNNIVVGNRAKYGGAIFSCSGKTGPEVTEPGGLITWLLTNNTVTGNIASEGVGGIQLCSGSSFGDGGVMNLLSHNDIIWGNSAPSRNQQLLLWVADGKEGVATATISYSDIGLIDKSGGGTYKVDHVIDKNPLLTDPANNNFTLKDSSPCIDSGDPNPIFNDGQRPLLKASNIMI